MASTSKTSLRKRLRLCTYRKHRRLTSHLHPANLRDCRSNTRSLSSRDTFTDAKLDPVCLVERIVGEKLIKGQKFYKVRWQGFPPDADSWEPEGNVSNVLESLASLPQNIRIDPSADSPNEPSSVTTTSSVSTPTPLVDPQEATFGAQFPVRSSSQDHRINQKSHKRKDVRKSRIAGRYEYVPKHQLIASKTKYFDDIRDGKIDLSSNDLYSRVKTRRRTSEFFVTEDRAYPLHNLNGSAQANCEYCVVDRTSEPSSVPSTHRGSRCSMSSDSSNGIQSTVDSTEFDHLSKSSGAHQDPSVDFAATCSLTPCTSTASDPISVDLSSCSVMNHSIPCLPEQCSLESGITKFRSASIQAVPHTTDVSVSPSLPLCNSPALTDNDDSAMGASCANSDHSVCDASSQLPVVDVEPVDEVSESTVSSLPQLIDKYFSLVTQTQSTHKNRELGVCVDENNVYGWAVTSLDELPKLQTYHRGTHIRTEAELVNAINCQHWTLLATVSSHGLWLEGGETMSQFTDETFLRNKSLECHTNKNSVYAKCAPEVLLPLLTDGPERPTLIDGVLSCSFDPNMTVYFGDSSEPLLIRAVRHRRVHVVQALLDAGAKPDHILPGSRNRTALGVALAAGDLDMVTLLMLAGSNFYQVETQTTALSFVLNLLKQRQAQSSTSGTSSSPRNTEPQIKQRAPSFMSPAVPCPSQPPGISIPASDFVLTSPFGNVAEASNGASKLCTSSPHDTPSGQCLNTEPPSVEALKRMYDLIAVHHARLSVGVTELVHGWLFKSGLTQVALLTPCQWVNVRMGSFSVPFTWPMSTCCVRPDSSFLSSRSVAPILLLVHGRITPPACYDTWMDDDGPCLVSRVCLDESVIQKPLSRALFVTTLFPLDWEASVGREHHVRVDFRVPSATDTLRPTCIAIMIIAVTPTAKESVTSSTGTRPPHSLSFSVQSCQSPCPQRAPINSVHMTSRRTSL